jgi:hypothetical protein
MRQDRYRKLFAGAVALAVVLFILVGVAQAAPPQKTLTVTVQGQGSVTLDPPGGTYPRNTVVTLTAVPVTGWQFDHWEGALSGSANPTTIVMSSNYSVTAVFVEESQEVTLAVSVTGNGSVAQNPLPPYNLNDTVTLTATADPGWAFDHWEGGLTGSTNPDTILMNSNKSVTAVFVQLPAVTLTVNITGNGSVTQDPVAPYYQGQSVTLTAVPDTGYAFDRWEGDLTGSTNPDTIVLTTNKTVTAVFVPQSGPTLTVNIVGQGSYSVDPPGPWTTNQTVKVSFYPSSGNQFFTKPDVPTAPVTDPLHGWAFDHWSFGTTTPQFGNEALANPASITLDTSKTIYATFLNDGTSAHPTATQESQLMDIGRSIWSGWGEMTQTQANELFVKAELALAEYRNTTQRYGQATSIWFTNFDRIEGGHVYDFCGEGMTWSGLHLAAVCMKHSQMPSDQQTIDDIQSVLTALDRNSRIGGDGYALRFSGPANDPAWQWYYQSYNAGWFYGVAPWTDYAVIKTTTRDVHTGYFLGLAAVLQYCSDVPTLYNQAVTITERIIDRLILDNWYLKDGKGQQELNNTILKQLQYRVGYKANPTKYSSFATTIANYTLDIGTQYSLYDSNYWVNWMNWARAYGICILETNPSKLATQGAHLKSKYDAVYAHQNVQQIAVANMFDPGTMPAWGHAQGQGLMLAYPDGVKWYRKVNLFQDPRFTTRDATYVNQAALPNQRLHHDFDPQRSAAIATGSELNYSYQHTNHEFPYAYWMLRLSGDIPAPN